MNTEKRETLESLFGSGRIGRDEIPKIVISIDDSTDQALIESAKFDIIEWRIDHFTSFKTEHVLRVLNQFKGYPSIATIRSKTEGGSWGLSETQRLELFQEIASEVNIIDIELSTIQNESTKKRSRTLIASCDCSMKKVIISYHNFDGTPSIAELNRIFKEARTASAHMVKIATLVKNHSDIQRLIKFTLTNKKHRLLPIAMGPIGSLSRVFFPVLGGSPMTYAYVGNKPTAPGQIHCNKLAQLIKRFYPQPAI